jgi:uncharacterized membrane protein YjgN (DUF898 family)
MLIISLHIIRYPNIFVDNKGAFEGAPQTKEFKMKRLWKSIAFFAIANMLAFTAQANATDDTTTLEGIATAAIYSEACDKQAFTEAAYKLMVILSKQYSEQERVAARDAVMGNITDLGSIKLWCAAMKAHPGFQRAVVTVNTNARKFYR